MRPSRYLPWRSRTLVAAVVVAALVAAGCASGADDAGRTLRIYTSVTQDTVDAVLAGFEAANPEVTTEVFRAPTGELTARIAAETREGGLQADVLWLTDPLSMQQYAVDGLLRSWSPDEVDAVPEAYRTDTFFGTRVLNMVVVVGDDAASPPEDWADLTEVDGMVAIPDPGFAGSAFGALAFFATAPGLGPSFYTALRAEGAVQVAGPGDVITGVAEGIYAAGVTLDRLARDAVADGSPLTLVWPESGAIAVYSPIAVVDASASPAAEPFVNHVLGRDAQEAIAATGWEPIRSDVPWPEGGTQQTIDWEQAFSNQDELLADYRSVFGQ